MFVAKVVTEKGEGLDCSGYDEFLIFSVTGAVVFLIFRSLFNMWTSSLLLLVDMAF